MQSFLGWSCRFIAAAFVAFTVSAAGQALAQAADESSDAAAASGVATEAAAVVGTAEAVVGNGLGNLIVGYNEPHPDVPGQVLTGSHNLLVGMANSHASVAGLIAGTLHTASAPYAAMVGGSGGGRPAVAPPADLPAPTDSTPSLAVADCRCSRRRHPGYSGQKFSRS